MSYDNTNRGTLGRNKRREKDTHPEYNGKLNVDGKDYWLSAWVKESKGDRFFSLSVKPVEDTGRREPRTSHAASSRGRHDEIDDGVPF